MQIKASKKKEIKNTQDIPSIFNRNIVYELAVKDLFKDNGKRYISNLRGTFAYIFDYPLKVSNSVLIDWGTNDTKTVLSIAEFIHHLIFWRANITLNYPIIKSKDLHTSLADPHPNTIAKICDKITRQMIEHENAINEKVCNCISLIKEDLSYLAEGWAPIELNTINDYDIIEFKNRNIEFNDLVNTELDDTRSIGQLEQDVKTLEKRLTKVIESDNKNCLSPYVRSGRIKIEQLSKILCAVGTRSDIDKSIFPVPIKRGYIHGLQNAGECYIDAVTARDAILIKSQNVPLSGALSRQINRLTSNIAIDYSVEDCGSQNYLSFVVENEDYLNMIEGKYYLDEKANKLKVIDKTDLSLVGKTLLLRSAVGCCHKRGICKRCVGEISKRFKKTRIGTLVPIKVINPMSNKSMSAKHNMATKSVKITSDIIKKYFHNEGTNFFVKQEFLQRKDLYIVVLQEELEDIIYSNSINSTDDFEMKVKLSFISIRDGDKDYPIENDGMEILLSDEILQNRQIFIEDGEDSEYILIPITKVNESDPIFNVTLYTEEITKYLNTFINAIDRATVSTRYKSYDELIKEIVDIVYKSGFVNKFIHYENIVYHMVRDINDITIRPDMSIKGVPYQILNISNAIERGNMYDALSYQGLRRLFKSNDIHVRYGNSVYDQFFKISPLY